MKRLRFSFAKGKKGGRIFLLISSCLLVVLLVALAGIFMYTRMEGLQKRLGEELIQLEEGGREAADDEVRVSMLADSMMRSRFNKAFSSYANPGLVICGSFINLWAVPAYGDPGQVIGILQNGAMVDILENGIQDAPDWVRVRSGGMEGYVLSRFILNGLDVMEEGRKRLRTMARILSDGVLIRSSPEEKEGNVIGCAVAGEKYSALSRVGAGWIEIVPDPLFGSEKGYVPVSDKVLLEDGFPEAFVFDYQRKILPCYNRLGVSGEQVLDIRNIPDEEAADSYVVAKLPPFGGVDILSEEDGWYRVSSGDVFGFLPVGSLKVGEEADYFALLMTHPYAVCNNKEANVYAEAVTDSQIWTSLSEGERYEIKNWEDGWVKVLLDEGDDAGTAQDAFVSTRDIYVALGMPEAQERPFPSVEGATEGEYTPRDRLVQDAFLCLGNPCVPGGTSLTEGCSCGGFTAALLSMHGIPLPLSAKAQARCGTRVELEDRQPGDLVFYADRTGSINQVAVYAGNDRIIAAMSQEEGIALRRWDYRTPVLVRAVL